MLNFVEMLVMRRMPLCLTLALFFGLRDVQPSQRHKSAPCQRTIAEASYHLHMQDGPGNHEDDDEEATDDGC